MVRLVVQLHPLDVPRWGWHCVVPFPSSFEQLIVSPPAGVFSMRFAGVEQLPGPFPAEWCSLMELGELRPLDAGDSIVVVTAHPAHCAGAILRPRQPPHM